MNIDKGKALDAQRRVHVKNGYNVDDDLITADQLRELFDERDGNRYLIDSLLVENYRYKAALEFIASSSNCGTCDACLGAAKDALKP